MPKFTNIPTQTTVNDTDYAMGTSGGNDVRWLWSNVLVWLKAKTAWVTKSNLEKPHYGCLYFSDKVGSAFGSETTPPYDTYDPSTYGIVPTTGSNCKLTIARDGMYSIQIRASCIDVQANTFISWIFVTPANGDPVYGIRAHDKLVPVASSAEQNATIFLKAGDSVYQHWYNGGSTRFGTSLTGTPTDIQKRIATSLTVLEIR